MSDHFYAVIMAGGGGTRLWPLSRKETPKQMLQLIGERTMFQLAVDRLEGLFPAERILVVTVAEQAAGLQEQCPEIPAENYLLEPMPRGTASVVGLAAIELIRRDPEATMAILTADHYIEDIPMFQNLLLAASDVAQRGNLVTLGIVPTFPATGYGYVQRGQELGKFRGVAAYHALRFKEKPDIAKAKEMIAGKDHYWNSGMFIWRVDRILEEIRGLMPDLAGKLVKFRKHGGVLPGMRCCRKFGRRFTLKRLTMVLWSTLPRWQCCLQQIWAGMMLAVGTRYLMFCLLMKMETLLFKPAIMAWKQNLR